MNEYVITYTQEVTQRVKAVDILAAARYARQRAAADKMLVVQIYNVNPPALPAPDAPAGP